MCRVNIQPKKRIIVNNQSLKTSKRPASHKKPPKKDNSHKIVDEFEILDGEVKLIRTTKSGQFWSMSCWLSEEKKCYRRSLRTKNRDEAAELAREKFFQLKYDIKHGNRIFTKTAEELVQDFIRHKTSEAEPIHKKVYYKQWPLLLKECGLAESDKNLAYYSLRHTYITMRLIAGTNIFFLAKNVGTSVRMIENHYEHVKTDAMKHELTKSRKRDEATKILLGDQF